ncbi:O-linked N-acetylglucosamine transferase family protein [Burkholderia seminalis]|uniref:O-linked N-acetylglucosamine transferase, SPINDLY family protein n=1 Tax=Burkholderia seminalis TaxID=488731 RepID=UPI0026559A49|nr:tetratricopeptide repeat protein [Burkholderia seminalis]MDN7852700.1 tetratricopeptide repeat protein [Burkholderia seminalis]
MTGLVAERLNAALAHHQAGRLDDARVLYEAIRRDAPDQPDATHFLGLLACQLGQFPAGLALMERAIALRADPVYLNNLGNMLRAHGRLDDAIGAYRRAIALAPGYAEAHSNLGNALHEAGDADAAMLSCAQALALRPDFAPAYNNLGNALRDKGEADAAARAYEKALALDPAYAEACFNLGNVCGAQHRHDDAIAHYRRAIALQPGLHAAHHALGMLLLERGELDAAIASLACAAESGDVDRLFGLAAALDHAGDLDGAVASLRRALAVAPDRAELHHHLAQTLVRQGKRREALDSCRVALSLPNPTAQMHAVMGDILCALWHIDAGLASYDRALELDPAFRNAHSGRMFHGAGTDRLSAAQLRERACAFGAQMAALASPHRHAPRPANGRALRVGFVSGDLKSHPVAVFLLSVVAALDRSRVELVAYATQPVEDDTTAALKRHFALWRDLTPLDDRAAADLIAADRIDVLVDLSGHTASNRLPLFAWKPAPVQATWLGYFATTGVAAIDYVIGDHHVLPPDEAAHFVERPWRLPDSYLCFTPPALPLDVGPLPAEGNGCVTFGCLNNANKIGEPVVALWSRVLHAVPGSRLLLKSAQLDEAALRTSLAARFAAHGIPAERLLLRGGSKRLAHIGTFNDIDIVLDPFPYPGGTTSMEGLWMGAPFVTRRGDRFLSHIGESILHTLGMPEWIADGDDAYVAKAAAFANDLPRLAAVRAGLRERLLRSPLCDAPRFARHLEAAFAQMHAAAVEQAARGAH